MNFWLDVYNDTMEGEYLSEQRDARADGPFRRVDWFYSDALTNDPEGCLVVLCEACARQHEAEIDGYAQDGDGNDTCERCGRKAR